MLVERKRNANVVCSYESTSLNNALIDYLLTEEMDAIRLIVGSGELLGVLEFCGNLRSSAPASGRRVSIMLDILSRPRAVIHGLAAAREFEFGQKVRVGPPGTNCELHLETEEWAKLFVPGAQVFIGFGSVMLKVVELDSAGATLEVVQGGVAHPEMDVHVPATRLPPRFEDISEAEIKAIVKHEIDYLVVPGFDTVEDLIKLRDALEQYKTAAPWIILKINSERVYKKLDELLPFVRGVLVSRLELAMSMNPAQVPMITKEIIQTCSDQAKIVLVASEMLASMRHNATPTRAEVSDIANAVMDGADSVVLSEDLPYGAFARRGLVIARRTIEDIEESSAGKNLNWIKHRPIVSDELAAITYTAYKTAQRNKAKAIVCITKSGNTALHLASFRPGIPVIAVTLSEDVQRRMSLIRGVVGLYLASAPVIDEVLPKINDKLVNESWLKKGDKIVFVSVTISSVGHEASNLFTVQTLA